MPKVRRSKKPPPDGWELIEPTLEELEQKMREAETEPHEGKRKVESLWPIFKIHHQKSRYIYDLYYRRKAISKEKLKKRPQHGLQPIGHQEEKKWFLPVLDWAVQD